MIEKGIKGGIQIRILHKFTTGFFRKKFEYESRAHKDTIPNEVEAENPVLLSLYPT